MFNIFAYKNKRYVIVVYIKIQVVDFQAVGSIIIIITIFLEYSCYNILRTDKLMEDFKILKRSINKDC